MYSLSDIGTIATILSGFATAGGLIFVGIQTRMLRNERNLTLRAWIGIGNPTWTQHGYYDDNGKFISNEKYNELHQEEKNKFKNVHKSIDITNYGKLPAENLKGRQMKVIGRAPTKKDIEEIPLENISVMMPSSSLKLFTTFTKEESDIIKDPDQELYFIWEVEYESPKGKKRKQGEIMRFAQQIYTPVESWNEDT